MKAKFVLLLFFVTVYTNLLAQNNPFVGGWELTGIPPDAGVRFQKFFDDKGLFYNVRTMGGEVIKTHHGKYVIKSGLEYWEFIAEDTAPFMTKASGVTAHIYYKFSDDKKLLTLRADAVPGNSGWAETWSRIEVERVAAGSNIRYRSRALKISDSISIASSSFSKIQVW